MLLITWHLLNTLLKCNYLGDRDIGEREGEREMLGREGREVKKERERGRGGGALGGERELQ